jgi:hypothetical protein
MSDAMSSRGGVGNSFPTLATRSRFQSNNLRSSRSTFASSPGLTSPSQKYITWLTKGSSSLMARLQTVGFRVTISTSLCNVASIFVTDTLKRKPVGSVQEGKEDDAINDGHRTQAQAHGLPSWQPVGHKGPAKGSAPAAALRT